MKYDLIIWDFNGTLIDDVEVGIECINKVLERRGMKKISDVEAYRKLFCFPIIDYYKKLGFDFDNEPYSEVAKEWVAEYSKHELSLKAMPNAEKALKRVKELGIAQIILSSSEIELLKRQIENLGFSAYFDTLLGLDNIYAGGKTEMAMKWAEGRTHKALFVGDTLHDLETAEAIGADCILYSGGHGERKTLETSNVPVIDDLTDVEKFLY